LVEASLGSSDLTYEWEVYSPSTSTVFLSKLGNGSEGANVFAIQGGRAEEQLPAGR
jgi:hypothetical protein